MSTGVKISWIVFLGGSAAAASPFVLGEAMAPWGNGRFAFAMFGALFAVGGLLFAVFLWGRDRARQRLRSGRDRLARWTCTPAEWTAFAGEEAVAQASHRRLLLGITAVFMILATIVALFANQQAGVFVGLLMTVLWLICWAVAYATGRQRRDAAVVPEVCIGRDGLLVGDELHTWRGWSQRLEACTLQTEPVPQLRFSYSAMTRSGRVSTVVRVPVPTGRLDEAAAVVRQLQP